MAIINYADMVGAYPSLGNGYTAEQVNSYHIPYAIAEMEAALGKMYTVPFSSNNTLAKDIAMRLTYARIGTGSTEAREQSREQAWDIIEKLLTGKMSMVDGDGAALITEAPWFETDSYTPVFTRDDPEHWVEDPDRIENLRHERD